MNFSVILETTTISAAFAVAGAAAAYFPLVTRLQAARSDSSGTSQKLALRIEKLEHELEGCQRRLAEAEQRYVPTPDNLPMAASIHLNRRGQVTQLHRRGQSARNIASALGISQGEVKLMIKLHDLNRSAAPVKSLGNLSLNSSQILDKASGLTEGEA